MDLETQTRRASERWMDHWDRGPQRLRWSERPLQLGDPAPPLVLTDVTGSEFPLSDLWADGPALILFWRHFGCSCGVDRAGRLASEFPVYTALGARVALIGQGEPERTAAYASQHGLPPVTLLCDPRTDAYQAYSLLEGLPAQVLFDAPESWLDLDHETGVAFCQQRDSEGRPPVDNPWLLPGEFIVDGSGIVALAYRYNYCEDFPDPRVHYAVLRGLGKGSA